LLKAGASRYVYAYLILLVAQYALVNFKAFEARYYLFLLPWLGALSAISIAYMDKKISSDKAGVYATGLAAGIVLVILTNNVLTISESQHARDEEFAFAINAINENTPADAIILARKPHLPFYTARTQVFLPDLNRLEELKAYVLSIDAADGVYVYYGSAEQAKRKRYSSVLDDASRPDWLQKVAISTDGNNWMLLKFIK
jgi:hypothetical protein